MDSTEALVRISLIDTELGKLRAREKELTTKLTAEKTALANDEKRVRQLELDASTAARAVQNSIAVLTNEREQYSKREKQITEMGGAKAAKAMSSENDRATLVIETVEKELALKKAQLSLAETNYLEAEDATQGRKERIVLFEKDLNGQISNLRARIEEITKERTVKAKDLDSSILPAYEKLIQKYPQGAVTTIDDGACATCNTTTPVRISHPVKSGSPQQCPGCQRFLVSTMTVGTATPTEELI